MVGTQAQSTGLLEGMGVISPGPVEMDPSVFLSGPGWDFQTYQLQFYNLPVYLADRTIEDQKGRVTCPRSHSKSGAEAGANPGSTLLVQDASLTLHSAIGRGTKNP